MTMVGTCYFTSKSRVVNYYGPSEAKVKIKEGLAVVGEPPLKDGETLSVHPQEGRYFITTPTKGKLCS